MIIVPCSLAGAFLIDVDRVEDERGFFARVADEDEFRRQGIAGPFVQWSISFNSRAGTLRGMHWQAAPRSETKLVRVTRGSLHDVIVDIRGDSPTFKQFFAVTLDAETRRALIVPPGCAHGFQTLVDDTEVLYGITPSFEPELARGFRWDDPDVAISWPHADMRVISARDAALPSLAEVLS